MSTGIVDTLLTEYELAELLHVDVTVLRRWRRQGEGPPYLRMGTCVRYDPEDVRGYIEASRRRRTGAAA